MSIKTNVEVKKEQLDIFANIITSKNSQLILSSSAGSKVTISSSLYAEGNVFPNLSASITGNFDVTADMTVSGNFLVGGKIYDFDSSLVLSSSIGSIIIASGSLDFPNQDKLYHIRGVNSNLILSSTVGSVVTFSSALDMVDVAKSYTINATNSPLILTSSVSSYISLSGGLYIATNTTSTDARNFHIGANRGIELVISGNNITLSAGFAAIETGNPQITLDRIGVDDRVWFQSVPAGYIETNAPAVGASPISGSTSLDALFIHGSRTRSEYIILTNWAFALNLNFNHGLHWGARKHPKLFIHASGNNAVGNFRDFTAFCEYYHASSSGGYMGTGFGSLNLTPCSGTINLSGTAIDAGLIQNSIVAANSNFILTSSAGSLVYVSSSIKNMQNYYDTPKTLTSDTNLKISPSLLSQYILCNSTDASFILNLPVAANNYGLRLNIKKIESSANTITISASDGEKINTADTYVLDTTYEYVSLAASGTNWQVV